MTTKNTEILAEVRRLTAKLYGENGFEGDIQEIKRYMHDKNELTAQHTRDLDIVYATLYGKGDDKGLVGKVKELASSQKRLIIAVAILSALIGGGSAGLINLVN